MDKREHNLYAFCRVRRAGTGPPRCCPPPRAPVSRIPRGQIPLLRRNGAPVTIPQVLATRERIAWAAARRQLERRVQLAGTEPPRCVVVWACLGAACTCANSAHHPTPLLPQGMAVSTCTSEWAGASCVRNASPITFRIANPADVCNGGYYCHAGSLTATQFVCAAVSHAYFLLRPRFIHLRTPIDDCRGRTASLAPALPPAALQ